MTMEVRIVLHYADLPNETTIKLGHSEVASEYSKSLRSAWN